MQANDNVQNTDDESLSIIVSLTIVRPTAVEVPFANWAPLSAACRSSTRRYSSTDTLSLTLSVGQGTLSVSSSVANG